MTRRMLFFLIVCLACLAFAPDLLAQSTPDVFPGGELNGDLSECAGGCCATTTRETVMIAGFGLFWAVLSFFLTRAAMVSALVRKEWRPSLAAHTAISTTLVLVSVGVSILAYTVHGCWLPGFNLLAAFLGAVWAMHLVFTLVAVRQHA